MHLSIWGRTKEDEEKILYQLVIRARDLPIPLDLMLRVPMSLPLPPQPARHR